MGGLCEVLCDSVNITLMKEHTSYTKRGERGGGQTRHCDRKIPNFNNRDDRSKEDKAPVKTLVAYLFQSPVLSFCCMSSKPSVLSNNQ